MRVLQAPHAAGQQTSTGHAFLWWGFTLNPCNGSRARVCQKLPSPPTFMGIALGDDAQGQQPKDAARIKYLLPRLQPRPPDPPT